MKAQAKIVVDANIAVKWALPEPLHEKAKMLLKFCSESAISMIAPAFFLAEVDSILRKRTMATKDITSEEAEQAWELLQDIRVQLSDLTPLRTQAWRISIQLGHAHVYDSIYLALAKSENCEFWTADERLYNGAKAHFSFVRWLGNFNQ